jgi:predicted Rossmann-fold nucleotide-binding protein
VLLDVDGFWDPLVAQLDQMVRVGLLKPTGRALIQRADTPEGALAALESARLVPQREWITPSER